MLRLPQILLFFMLSASVPIWAERLQLAIALPPHAEVVEMLAGERVERVTVLRRGMDHETFSPSPRELRSLLESDLYWSSGLGFERALLRRVSALAPDLRIVAPAASEQMGEDHDHGQHDHGSHHHDDLHRWLDPRLMLEDARILAEALVEEDPAGENRYREGLRSFEALASSLHEELRQQLEPYAGRRFYVYHAAFDHFASAYGLEQVALERDGREASLHKLRELIAQARNDGVRVIYVQPQHRPVAAQTLAEQVGARLETLDPLAADWSANLKEIARTLMEGFNEADDDRP